MGRGLQPAQHVCLKVVQESRLWLCKNSNVHRAQHAQLSCVCYQGMIINTLQRRTPVAEFAILIERLQSFQPTLIGCWSREHHVQNHVWFQQPLRLHSVFFNATVSCVTLFSVQPLLSTRLISNPRLWGYYFSCFLEQGWTKRDFLEGDLSFL